jgi:DNA-binding CsgD family transcriptional regulator
MWRAGRTAEALTVVAPVLGRSDLSDTSELRLKVLLARTQILGGTPGEVVEFLAEAAERARNLHQADTLGYALAARSMGLRFLGQFDAAVVLAREAVRHRGDRDWPGVDPRLWLARGLAAQDRLEEAERTCGRFMHDAEGPKGARDLPVLSATLSRLYIAQGRVVDALTEAESGVQAMETGGGRELAAELFACAAIAAWMVAGDRASDEVLARASLYRDTPFGMNHLPMAKLIVEDGRDARRTADLAAPILAELAHSFGQLVFDPLNGPATVRCLLRAGLRDEAQSVAESCRRLADLNPDISSWAAADTYARALLAGDAEQLLAVADAFTASGRLLVAALASTDAALILKRRRRKSAQGALEAASKQLRELGAVAAAERVPIAASGPGTRGRARERPLTGWDSLTPAELRVVELAARGATNKEIAKELWLSPYTVDTHMRHSLAKLGLRSRVALARLAGEHEGRSQDELTADAAQTRPTR